MSKSIEITGARMHNLKHVDVSIPRNKMTVVTGVSGSGKSSLIFDTLFAEGQRRYVESLSSYARQFLGRLDKPEVDNIKGLTPCIAIEQKVNSTNPRSTVATSTEIYDYLKLLFARVGRTISPISNEEVKCHTTQDVVDFIHKRCNENDQVYIVNEISNVNANHLEEYLDLELKKGFSRLWHENKAVKIEGFNVQKFTAGKTHLLIDRLIYSKDGQDEFNQRVSDSIETAFFEGKGELRLFIKHNEQFSIHDFNNRFELDGMRFEIPTVNFLSFNNPFGACKNCQGFGTVIGIDEDLVIPNKSASLYEGCVQPWKGQTMREWKESFISQAEDFPIHKPYFQLSKSEKDLLWNGNGHTQGIHDFIRFLEENSYKIQYRVMLSKYRGRTICTECKGTRLRKDAQYVKLVSEEPIQTNTGEVTHHINLTEVLLMSVKEAVQVFEHLKLSANDSAISNRILKEILNRLIFLNDVGLGYLKLNRLSNSLSGGESQRINLATSLGSSLVGSTYILDEPSIGLHPEDTERLIGVLNGLKEKGNTVVVVEHDEEIMRAADELIDVGPEAGNLGGEIVFQGQFKDLPSAGTLTSDYLTFKKQIAIPEKRRQSKSSITIQKALHHNLKGIDVTFPLYGLTAVTGMSGSGKTSLVKGILYPAILRELNQYKGVKPGEHQGLMGDLKTIEFVEMVDQNPIGKSSRSNPVTYVKAYDAIRDLFSAQVLAKQRGYKPSTFSFNVDGGRCDQCQGEGYETVEMQFMADLYLPCEVCKGKRFKTEVLEVTYKGKNIHDVLSLTVDEAVDFFKDNSSITKKLGPLQEVGLGYIQLGQASNTLSGGEAQRVKLASFLAKGNPGHTLFIFDEPTTGLHFNDIKKLIASFNALIKKGNSIICIEHNLDVVKVADYVIDLGPGGGEDGGHLMFQGTPEELVQITRSLTGKYLADKLKEKAPTVR
jgi:excinuclease ABC subunit A